MKSSLFKITILIGLAVNLAYGQAVQENPEDLRKIDVVEHLGDTIPLDLHFADDTGKPVVLSNYFHQGKPVVLILGYYSCPMLCNLVMNGVSDVVKKLDWLPGKEFQIVSVSIDPNETDVLASAKKANYLKAIGKPGIDDGWMYLTGAEDQSKKLADAVGFKYFYIPDKQQYAHPAVLVILTDQGVISRYLYGIEYKDFDMRMALLEASQGKVGGTLDRIILYCYHYDPEAGSYTVFAGNIMRIGGAITLIIMLVLLSWLWLRERRKKTLNAATS
jgi:protein SCO1